MAILKRWPRKHPPQPAEPSIESSTETSIESSAESSARRAGTARSAASAAAGLRPAAVHAAARPVRVLAPRSDAATLRSVTVVVPTYREAENLPYLIERIAHVRRSQALDLELLIMDDDSRDGTEELLARRPEHWVRLVVRRQERGLSAAVLEGLRLARGDVLVCMDADLSHPPESLPDMLRKLQEGADFVVGSRYVPGGSTSDDWGILRWLNSRVATLLARPFSNTRDPMSGFFALRRMSFEAGRDFNPVGYKIGLELTVKCRCERVVEVPIHFENRRFGHSKLTFRQQLLYLQHLRRLYVYKYGLWSQLIQFLAVGGIGTAVNLAVLTLLSAMHVPLRAAIALAIWVSMSTNFMLNRRFSFAFARGGSWWGQYVRFVAASACGALVNYVVTVALLDHVPGLLPQVAALGGIMVGTGINFAASRYLVFRTAHVRLSPP
jgi:dolichol-phosphate mannosyltransferase